LLVVGLVDWPVPRPLFLAVNHFPAASRKADV